MAMKEFLNRLIELENKNLEKEYGNEKEVAKNTEFYLLSLLEKLTYNLFSLTILYEKFEQHPQLYGSIGLILRTCLSDIIFHNYFISLIDSGKNDYENQKYHDAIDRMWVDHLNYIIKFDRKKEQLGYLKQPYKSEEIDAINNQFKKYFSSELKPNWEYNLKAEFKNSLSISKLFDINDWNPTESDFQMFELYNHFSKLEHNGELTWYIQNYAIDNFTEGNKNIQICLGYIVTTIFNISKVIFASATKTISDIHLLELEYQSLISE
jgi:hypothetical protein